MIGDLIKPTAAPLGPNRRRRRSFFSKWWVKWWVKWGLDWRRRGSVDRGYRGHFDQVALREEGVDVRSRVALAPRTEQPDL